MEEIGVPAGKVLRYRCNVEGCQSKRPSYSINGIFEHLAYHYAHIALRTGSPFNYRCLRCGKAFYFLGMAATCPCTENHTEPKYVLIRTDLDAHDVKEDTRFLSYVQRHAVPVFCEDKSNLGGGEILTDFVPTRSSSTYSDGTPRTSNIDDYVEEEESPYDRALRSSSRSLAVTPGERAEISIADDLLRLGNMIPTERSSPADVPAVGSSSLHPEKRNGVEYGAPPRKSPVPTMGRPSRQDGLLTPNPKPPSISRRLSRSPAALHRPSSRSQFDSCLRRCETTSPLHDGYAERTSRPSCYSTPCHTEPSTSSSDRVTPATWQLLPPATTTLLPMSPLLEWLSHKRMPCEQMPFPHPSWVPPNSASDPQNLNLFDFVQPPSAHFFGPQVQSSNGTPQQVPSVSQASPNPRAVAQASMDTLQQVPPISQTLPDIRTVAQKSRPPERLGGSKFLEVLPASPGPAVGNTCRGQIKSSPSSKASVKRKRAH